ncbi:hypothetical protein X291_02310 [Oenococcus oeni IOEB_C23]|nr:unknown [Oenococcus phage fOg44]KER96968.1 hypothetical protein HT64_09770 [Oenococcus oeni]KGH66821.1 hypothetical protein X291_02310 [Oenococcus oeni IOEB_C23]CAD19156.1 hypothetical protein [Oenococcus phage fOg44]
MWLLTAIVLIVLCVRFFAKALPYLLAGIAITYAFIYWWVSLIVIALIAIYFLNKRSKKQ